MSNIKRNELLLTNDDGTQEIVKAVGYGDFVVELREGRGPAKVEWITRMNECGEMRRLPEDLKWLKGEDHAVYTKRLGDKAHRMFESQEEWFTRASK
tara:strand:- start:23598 stop:23888 length:291 start_codon:yes stop_codon:yes gene_type:complete